MLDNRGFDLWADEYDRTVQVSEDNNLYPFAGYKDILNMIFNEVMEKEQSRVLDIGFGTGVLTNKLYENGNHIDGLDFSPNMIAIAQEKMPKAILMEWDISKGLPDHVKEKEYDFVVSTYTLHHLTDEDKVELIKNLLSVLSKQGKIVIGDIAFQTREGLELCKKASSPYWDPDEFYFVFEEFQVSLAESCSCEFYPVSHCGGVIVISK
ncbi:putative AdoMet-dependent methyltransferase [Planomicrobium stackebrandtii]|uniref:AdoMet-dependent methyltransferase n=1 Tax=Planomicrobium stackebrandtii TaxID=253160 RepID=A0ABU0GPL3_9BACL|nr:class I SAM-dependent methyltransferase [Planomicrobium stackebrandtii]MDQ0427272.1 putative AdoMet-dependent methyltransferase [Planomicrobium stackebrandtii]